MNIGLQMPVEELGVHLQSGFHGLWQCTSGTPGASVSPSRTPRAYRLPGSSFWRNLHSMELHFTPEQEARLAQLANEAGTDAKSLVKEAALRLLEEDARFRAAVREGVAQADRGRFIEEADMEVRLKQLLRS